MQRCNFPEAQASRELSGSDFTEETVKSVLTLSKKGKPQNLEELRNRLDLYFQFCADRRFRPGVENLSLALGVSRVCFWQWCNREDSWGEACRIARQCIIAFTEAAALSGHLSPPIAIFTLKNCAGWKDSFSFEELTPADQKPSSVESDEWRERFLVERATDERYTEQQAAFLPQLPEE